MADVLEGKSSGIPAPMGVSDMSALDVYYSVRTGAFIVPGPGGLNLNASPGADIVQMRRRGTHDRWFLPVSEHLYKSWVVLPVEKQISILHACKKRRSIPLGIGPRSSAFGRGWLWGPSLFCGQAPGFPKIMLDNQR